MMRNAFSILLSALLIAGLSQGAVAASVSSAYTERVSGTIQNGYRILEMDREVENIHLTVYRGDYIKFAFTPSIGDPVLSIPSLSIDQMLVEDLSEAPYFKMKRTGVYPFSLGHASGNIEVIEYSQSNYRAVSSRQAKELITEVKPLIIDVRTPAEFKRGHMENAVLIPVQELQKRIYELSRYKNNDILICCATGNRSTVASKILIDKGFQRITNLRYGIYEWTKMKYPVVR